MVTSNGQDQDTGCDIVDLLHERHEQISDAFAEVIDAEGRVKAELFDELVTTLAVREAVAQELVRPLVQRVSRGTSGPRSRPTEQTDIIDFLSRLSSMDVGDDHFDVELIGIARIVTLDIEALERDDLPLLRTSLPADELHALAELQRSAETIARSSARAVTTEITSPDALGPRDVYAALGHTIRQSNRP